MGAKKDFQLLEDNFCVNISDYTSASDTVAFLGSRMFKSYTIVAAFSLVAETNQVIVNHELKVIRFLRLRKGQNVSCFKVFKDLNALKRACIETLGWHHCIVHYDLYKKDVNIAKESLFNLDNGDIITIAYKTEKELNTVLDLIPKTVLRTGGEGLLVLGGHGRHYNINLRPKRGFKSVKHFLTFYSTWILTDQHESSTLLTTDSELTKLKKQLPPKSEDSPMLQKLLDLTNYIKPKPKVDNINWVAKQGLASLNNFISNSNKQGNILVLDLNAKYVRNEQEAKTVFSLVSAQVPAVVELQLNKRQIGGRYSGCTGYSIQADFSNVGK
jgi:hypothetical protein